MELFEDSIVLSDFYETIEVWEQQAESGSWDDTENLYPSKTRDINGFLQPVSGTEAFQNGKNTENATHRLYVDISETLNQTDRIKKNSLTFEMRGPTQADGISAVEDHKEYLVEYINV